MSSGDWPIPFLTREPVISKRATIIGVLLLFSISVALAQTPSPDAMSAARKLVDTLKLSDEQIGQDGARKAGDDLRTRLTDLLRQKGHKM